MNMAEERTALFSYLKAQSHINPAVAFDSQSCTLSDISAGARPSALVAKCGDSSLAISLAPYVGYGALSVLVADTSEDHTDEASDSKSATSGIWLFHRKEGAKQSNTAADRLDKEHVPELRLEMDDIVWHNNLSSGSIGKFGAGVILMLKICGALSASHEAEAVANVGTLVRNNTMTAVYSASRAEADAADLKEHAEAKVGGLLRGLLDQSQERMRTVHMNSNEPVLLINNAGSLSDLASGTIVTETVEQLQRDWNIWPVRIYAGRFLEDIDISFSITLFNVTNTDIGGPSMIQLLDAPCEARGWLGYARREVWHGRELLEKDERWQQKITDVGPAAPVSSIDKGTVDTEEEAQIPVSSSEIEQTEHQEPTPIAAVAILGTAGSRKVPEDSGLLKAQDKRQEEAEEPDEDVRKRFEADPAPILHPTWDHPSGSESLLDLVKSQASATAATQRELSADDESDASTKSSQPHHSAGDDEFVVV